MRETKDLIKIYQFKKQIDSILSLNPRFVLDEKSGSYKKLKFSRSKMYLELVQLVNNYLAEVNGAKFNGRRDIWRVQAGKFLSRTISNKYFQVYKYCNDIGRIESEELEVLYFWNLEDDYLRLTCIIAKKDKEFSEIINKKKFLDYIIVEINLDNALTRII